MSGESPELRGILGAVRERLAAFRALWRDFTGESAYEKYVERHRREHPGHAPMTERTIRPPAAARRRVCV